MGLKYQEYVQNLNHENVEVRLKNLKKLLEMLQRGEIERPKNGWAVNNHIHTIYSFSPYSPTKALWMAYNAGLITAGIMDHDSISGAKEFIEAGKMIGMATTIGVECRVDFSNTPLNGRRINNPDQKSIAYMALHGIPHTEINKVREFFAPYTEERNKRNRLMVQNINKIIQPFNILLNYEKDIVSISKSSEGGSITERHILFGLSLKLIGRFGKGEKLLNFVKNELNLNLSIKAERHLLDINNPYYAYDLLGVLKRDMVSVFYIDATAECPDVKDVIALSDEIGAISSYAYLGDVGDSVTGDKKSQKFEDDYLELLFQTIKDLGLNAVTYMPSRNTMKQLIRLKDLCLKYDFFEISGEDINSPRQSFVCEALKDEVFDNLIDSTWALIGHEKSVTRSIENGMFSQKMIKVFPDLMERVEVFKKAGKLK